MNQVSTSPLDPPPLAPFCDPIGIRQETAAALLTSQRLRPSEAAAQYRYIRNAAGGYSEEWDNARTPYLVEPQDAYAVRGVRTIIYVGPAQGGKTTALVENTALYSIIEDNADELIVCPSEALARDFSERKIAPMNETCPELRRRLFTGRGGDNNLKKTYLGMSLTLAWPSPGQLSMRSIPRIKITDYDRFPTSAGKEGDPFDMARKRPQTFGRKARVLVESSPGRPVEDPGWKPKTDHEAPPTTGILALYNQGDRRRWQWRCPHCGDFFEGRFDLLSWDKDNPNILEAAASVVMDCPLCGVGIEPRYKASMNAGGIWVPEGQWVADGKLEGPAPVGDTRSYWQKGPSATWQSWADMVRLYLEARQIFDRTGNEEKLRVTTNVDQAEAYVDQAARSTSTLEAEDLARRAEGFPLGVVPRGAVFLTAGVDVQAEKFRVLVRAWGADLESWIVDLFDVYERAEGGLVNPAKRKEDWDLLTEAVLDKRYPLADGSGRTLGIRLAACDSGGAPGVTFQAYGYYRRLRRAGRHRGLILTKGTGLRTAPRYARTYPDTRRRSDRKSAAKADVPVWIFQADMLKDELRNQLEQEDPGQLYVHISGDLCRGPGPHGVLEQLTAEGRKPDGTWHKLKRKNDALDQAIMSHVAALVLEIERINWAAPPAWAAPWDENAGVEGAEAGGRPAAASDETAAEPAQPRRPRGRRRNFAKDW